MERVDLTRYEKAGRLGTGADYEVRAAVDRETGDQVVLKRPVPQMVRRQLHGHTEARTERTLSFYETVGHKIPAIVPILGYTEPQVHDDYFGDSLEYEYRVIVEKRASGIPLLISDPRARITKVAVGVAQNLFALFPLAHGPDRSVFAIHNHLLDLQEAVLNTGYLLLDMGPQNIFYQPATSEITVIDTGALAAANGELSSRGKPPPDIHDFYLEMLKYYTTAQQPPAQASGYQDPHGMRPVVRFDEELEEMGRNFDQAGGPQREPALQIINSVRGRAYETVEAFRQDLMDYLDAVALRNYQLFGDPQVRDAWDEALSWLRGEYWQRFLFDPDTELTRFNNPG